MQRNQQLFKTIEVGMYAALIILAITFLRVPMPSAISRSFVHPGNALVVLGALLMGARRGTAAAAIGLFIFDAMNGYLASAPFTVLENVLVIIIVEWVYRRFFHRVDSHRALITLGIVAGISKVLLIFIKFVGRQLALGMNLPGAIATALTGLPASLFTALVTAILIPLLYRPLKQIVIRFHPVGE